MSFSVQVRYVEFFECSVCSAPADVTRWFSLSSFPSREEATAFSLNDHMGTRHEDQYYSMVCEWRVVEE